MAAAGQSGPGPGKTTLVSRRGRLLQLFRNFAQNAAARWREKGRQRLIGVVLALLAEAVLILAVLSLGWVREEPKPKERNLVSMALEPSEEKPPEKAATKASPTKPNLTLPQVQAPTAMSPQPNPSQPATTTPAPIQQVAPNQLAKFDLSKLPRQPAGAAPPGKGLMGPPNLGVPGDTKRVGTAPNGQPMYAAAWYREPTDDELSGFLSTADGPGWALIACRTAPDFRVEDCVGLDEYPSGSRMLRAVLAAAWQFKVRPPRIGGVSQVGTWVRIRIEYTEARR
jgi:protein TonB